MTAVKVQWRLVLAASHNIVKLFDGSASQHVASVDHDFNPAHFALSPDAQTLAYALSTALVTREIYKKGVGELKHVRTFKAPISLLVWSKHGLFAAAAGELVKFTQEDEKQRESQEDYLGKKIF